ncbi:hypothetical protein D3C86_1480150 [compost metagenome]
MGPLLTLLNRSPLTCSTSQVVLDEAVELGLGPSTIVLDKLPRLTSPRHQHLAHQTLRNEQGCHLHSTLVPSTAVDIARSF